MIPSLSSLIVLALVCCSPAGACESLISQQFQSKLIEYVRAKFDVPPNVDLQLSSSEVANDSCYLKLKFVGVSPLNTWHLVTYLSPNRRFLSTELFDTLIDPAAEAAEESVKVAKALETSHVPVRGATDAPIQIVEFSDFQCPFCKSFSELLKSENNPAIRVSFRHFPLNGHTWARKAADVAACASLQSSEAFWKVHDFLFAVQESLSEENIVEKALAFAKTVPTIDSLKLSDCIENDLALGLVIRDIKAGNDLNVTGTPSLFINGKRVSPFYSKEEFESYLQNEISRQKGSTAIR